MPNKTMDKPKNISQPMNLRKNNNQDSFSWLFFFGNFVGIVDGFILFLLFIVGYIVVLDVGFVVMTDSFLVGWNVDDIVGWEEDEEDDGILERLGEELFLDDDDDDDIVGLWVESDDDDNRRIGSIGLRLLVIWRWWLWWWTRTLTTISTEGYK